MARTRDMNKLHFFLLFTILIVVSFSVRANFAKNYEEAKQWAAEQQTNLNDATNHYDLKANIPKYNEKPTETGLYGRKDGALNQEASKQKDTNQYYQDTSKRFNSNEHYIVDMNSNEMKRSEWYLKHSTEIMQSMQAPCSSGDCSTHEKTPDKNFGQAAGALTGLFGAGDAIAADGEMRIFTGKSVSCRHSFADYIDCCKDDGWGAAENSCSPEEKKIKQEKKLQTLHYVGKYCSHKVMGFCTEEKKVYCMFNNQMGRLIQEQGRYAQLNIEFGDGKHPDCRGMTPEELQRIDFSKINFTEVTAELETNVNNGIGNPDQIAQRMQEDMNNKAPMR